MRTFWIYTACASVLIGLSSIASADDTEAHPQEIIKVLGKEAGAATRKANDYRVLGMNALKNADAVRGEAHKKLLEAMLSGDAGSIDEAKDGLSNAAEDLEDLIKDVERIIECSVKVEMLAKKAEALCQTGADADGGIDANSLKNAKSFLAAAGRDLGRAERIARELRRDWLDPVFVSTSTTSTTTTTGLPPEKPAQ